MSSLSGSFDKQSSCLSSGCHISSEVRDEINSFVNSQGNSLSREAKEMLSSLMVRSNSLRMLESQNRGTVTQNTPPQQASTTGKTIRNAMCLIGVGGLLCLVYAVAKNKGYAEGYADSITGAIGYENGKSDGIRIGYENGYNDGVEKENKSAYRKGFREGCELLSDSLLEFKEKIYQAMLNNGWNYLQCNQVMEQVDVLSYGKACYNKHLAS